METLEYLSQYYDNYDEDGRLTSRHGSVEFLTTMRYIERYISPESRVLEIGAGTGRYSHALARMGYEVHAVELVESNIAKFRTNTLPSEQVSIVQGNAVNLAGFQTGAYDITLLLGPMYHLFRKDDKLAALSEAIRVTKPGGVVFVAYCIGDASVLDYGFKKGNIHELIKKRMLSPDTFKIHSDPWDLFELHRKEDIDALMEGLPATRLHYLASDGYTNHMRETIDSMDDETFVIYLNYHFFLCERPDIVGLTNHALDVFRKNLCRED